MTLADIEPGVWIAISVLSLALFAGSVLVLRALVIRMPGDYFRHRGHGLQRSGRDLALRVGKNLAGALLLAVGVVMLFTPGQGILTILMGVMLLDFPGKYRLERWLILRPGVLSTINAWRERAGRAALVLDD